MHDDAPSGRAWASDVPGRGSADATFAAPKGRILLELAFHVPFFIGGIALYRSDLAAAIRPGILILGLVLALVTMSLASELALTLAITSDGIAQRGLVRSWRYRWEELEGWQRYHPSKARPRIYLKRKGPAGLVAIHSRFSVDDRTSDRIVSLLGLHLGPQAVLM
jgi:hypothetical protein